MLIAITGATGFVGRHLTGLLIERGHRVRALVRSHGRRPWRTADAVESVTGDVSSRAALEALLAGAEAAINLVGIIAERGRNTFWSAHVEGARAVAETARLAGVRRVVHMSAVGARDVPGATPYHRSKWQGEEAVRGAGLPAVIFRPSFISGAGNIPIQTLARLHRWLPIVPVFGDGRFPVQPVWVGDVSLAFALAAEGACAPEAYELGGPDVVTYEEFVRAIGRAAGYPRPVAHIPLSLVSAMASAFDLLGPYAPITTDQLQMLTEGNTTPDNALKAVFGIDPLPFEEGLKRYLGRA